MPSYKENLKFAQQLLSEIGRRNIATPEDSQGFPMEAIWKKINFTRDEVSKKIVKEKAEELLLLPRLTSCVTTTALNVGACQELCHLAAHLSLESGRSDMVSNLVLVTLGNQKQIRSGNPRAENHMIIMLGPVSYDANMIHTKDSKPNDEKGPTLDEFFSNQPASVVILDPLCNFAGSPADCPSFKQYCTSYQITDVLSVVPYRSIIDNSSISMQEIAATVERNATRIATEIVDELNKSLLQAAKENQPATFMFPILFCTPNFTVDDIIDASGMTLPHYACLYGNEVLANYYIKISPDLMSLTNKDGRTPLDYLSASPGKIKETLVSAGLSPSDDDIRKILANVKQLKAKLLSQGHHSDWLLRKEAYDGELDNLKCLAKSKPERINEFGLPSKATALHQAARQGHANICSFLINMSGILIDVEDKDGNTPLLLAIKNQHFHLVPLFVKARAVVNKTNAAGESARSLLANLGQDSLLSVGSEASAGILSSSKGLMHFSPAPPQQPPPNTGDNSPRSRVP